MNFLRSVIFNGVAILCLSNSEGYTDACRDGCNADYDKCAVGVEEWSKEESACVAAQATCEDKCSGAQEKR